MDYSEVPDEELEKYEDFLDNLLEPKIQPGYEGYSDEADIIDELLSLKSYGEMSVKEKFGILEMIYSEPEIYERVKEITGKPLQGDKPH